MASEAVKPGNLSSAVQKILQKYEGDVEQNMGEITKKVAQKGAQRLRSASKQAVGGTGKYAKGWAVTEENTRLSKTAVIHHKTMPGLPHLLEHGHVSVVNGKRVGQAKAHEHILPVERELVEEYEREVLKKL